MSESARQDTRVIAPVAMILEIDGKPEACFTRNISHGGMFVVTRRRAAVDSIVKVSIFRDRQRLATDARVINCADDGLGLRFIHKGPEFGEGITALLTELLTEGSQAAPEQPTKVSFSWAHLPDGRAWNWWRKSVHSATVSSLSLDGAALICRSRPKLGETVLFFISGRDVPDGRQSCQAEVVRHVERGFAVKLVEPSIAFRRTVTALRRHGTG